MPTSTLLSPYRLLLAIALAGMAVRVLFVQWIPLQPVADFGRYLEVASSVASGGGFRISDVPYVSQPPLYPGVLGIWFMLTGVSVGAGKLLNLLLCAGTLASWIWMGARLQLRPAWQLISLAALSFHPALVAYCNVLGTESLALFLAVLGMALAVARFPGRLLLMGAVLALTALNRPQMLPLPGAVALAMLLRDGIHSSTWRRIGMMLLGFLLVLGPWTLRNALIFGQLVPVSANSGYVLMVNNNDANTHGGWMPLRDVPLQAADQARFADAGFPHEFFAGDSEDWKLRHWTPAADVIGAGIGRNWIAQHPGRFLQLALLRLRGSFDAGSLMHWPFLEKGGAPVWLGRLTGTLNLVLAAWAAIALLRMCMHLRNWQTVHWLAVATLGLGLLSILLFEGQGRYLLPLLPGALFIIAAAGTLRLPGPMLGALRSPERSTAGVSQPPAHQEYR
ncbi:ArnT family glycosyltransferase [Stenotrophomonas indicatrix]|jgi:hypothetical protein|uniref:ArnT family glycosyltransferase n=1 Tax=Stenotrophomonas indicatrix TaxID=2045451 RepID=UPI0028A029E0|nr:hypothetical protein [Stenotrophomonas indicatrix]